MEATEEELKTFTENLLLISNSNKILRERAEEYFNDLRDNFYEHFVFLCFSVISNLTEDTFSIVNMALVIMSRLFIASPNLPINVLFEKWSHFPPEFHFSLVSMCMELIYNGPDSLFLITSSILNSFHCLGFENKEIIFKSFTDTIKDKSVDQNLKRKCLNVVKDFCKSVGNIEFQWINELHETIMAFLHSEDLLPCDLCLFFELIESIYGKNFKEYNTVAVNSNYLEGMSFWLSKNISDESFVNTAFTLYVDLFKRTYGTDYFPNDALLQFIRIYITSEDESVINRLLNALCECTEFENDKEERNIIEKKYNAIIDINMEKSMRIAKKYRISQETVFTNYIPTITKILSNELFLIMQRVPDDAELYSECSDAPNYVLVYKLFKKACKMDSEVYKIIESFLEREEIDNWQFHFNNLQLLAIATNNKVFGGINTSKITDVINYAENENDLISFMALKALNNFRETISGSHMDHLVYVLFSLENRNPILLSKCAKVVGSVIKCNSKMENSDFSSLILTFTTNIENQFIEELDNLALDVLNNTATNENIHSYVEYLVQKLEFVYSTTFESEEETIKLRNKFTHILKELVNGDIFFNEKELVRHICSKVTELLKTSANKELIEIEWRLLYMLDNQKTENIGTLIETRDTYLASMNPEEMILSTRFTALVVDIKLATGEFTAEDCVSEFRMLLGPLMDENCREDSYPEILKSLSMLISSFCLYSPYASNCGVTYEIPEECISMIFEAFGKVESFNFDDSSEGVELSNQMLNSLLSCYIELVNYYRTGCGFLQNNIKKIFSITDKVANFAKYDQTTLETYLKLLKCAKENATTHQVKVYLTRKNIIRPVILSASSKRDSASIEDIKLAFYF